MFVHVVVTVHFTNICLATHRSTLSSHWVNFHDPESDLLDMEWRAGTSPGYGDILSPTRLHVTDKVTVNLTDPLPLGRRIYVTLKVFNRAGRTDQLPCPADHSLLQVCGCWERSTDHIMFGLTMATYYMVTGCICATFKLKQYKLIAVVCSAT